MTYHPTGRANGRPTKFTVERRQKVLTAIKGGNHYQTCAQYAGVTYQTLRNWMVKGEKAANKEPKERTDEENDYAEFYLELTQLESANEMLALRAWKDAFTSDWKSARDYLARRFPDRWGQKVEVSLSAKDDEIMDLLDVLETDVIEAEVIETNEIPEAEAMKELPPGNKDDPEAA